MSTPGDATKRPLPDGWRWVKLGEVCELIIGRTPSRSVPEYWGGALPWVTIADLNNGVITHTKETISELGASASRSRLLRAGTILFSFKLTIGKMGIAGIDLYTNEAIVGVIPKEPTRLINDYLWFALKSINPEEDSSHAVKGKTLNQKTLDTLSIPLPPLAEQQRIAALLREQMAAVERARRAAEEQLEAAKSLPAAYFRAFFNCPVAQQWPRRRLGEFLLEVRNGIYKPNSYYGRGTPMIRMFNIGRFDGKWDLRVVDSVVVTPEEIRCFELREGDVVVNRVNSRELVAKCAVVDQSTAGFVFESKNMRVRLKAELVLPDYFSAWLNCEAGREQILTRLKQIVGQATINRSDLENLELPVPPLPVQRQVVVELAAQMAAAERARQAIEEQLEAINKLPAAILRKAFNGEL